jgi:hypothetical protein
MTESDTFYSGAMANLSCLHVINITIIIRLHTTN